MSCSSGDRSQETKSGHLQIILAAYSLDKWPGLCCIIKFLNESWDYEYEPLRNSRAKRNFLPRVVCVECKKERLYRLHCCSVKEILPYWFKSDRLLILAFHDVGFNSVPPLRKYQFWQVVWRIIFQVSTLVVPEYNSSGGYEELFLTTANLNQWKVFLSWLFKARGEKDTGRVVLTLHRKRGGGVQTEHGLRLSICCSHKIVQFQTNLYRTDIFATPCIV